MLLGCSAASLRRATFMDAGMVGSALLLDALGAPLNAGGNVSSCRRARRATAIVVCRLVESSMAGAARRLGLGLGLCRRPVLLL